jgi:hypothetical protein
MSVSDEKLNANRENAQHSTGPRTPEGKQRSSFNATRHGLTGQVNVRTEEEQKARETHSEGFFQTFRPVGTPEEHLVQTMADKQWQIHRADAWIDSIFAVGQIDLAGKIDVEHPQIHAALTEGLITMKHARQLDLIGRYASRLQRDYRAAFKDLQTLQTLRKQHEQQQMFHAAEVKKFCEMKQEPFIPAAFGFVSQPQEIDTYITRSEYIEQAAIAHRVNFNIEKYRAAVN